MLEVFETICKNFSSQKLGNTLNKVIPRLFTNDDDKVTTSFLCDCALILAKDLKVTKQSKPEIKNFKKLVKEKYARFILIVQIPFFSLYADT